MQLNITTDYAIRSLIYIAEKDREVSRRDICSATKIPENYLYKLMAKFRECGYVEAIRWIDGGYKLIVDPKDISVFDIVTLVEGPININRCALDGRECSKDGHGNCKVHAFYVGLQGSIEKTLRKTTLKSLMR